MCCKGFLKVMMFVFNGVIFLAGAAVLGVGIWVAVDRVSLLGILDKIEDAPPELAQLANIGYVLIGVGAFLTIMGFLGCCGAMKESKCMLLLFFIIVLIIFLVEVAAAIVLFVFEPLVWKRKRKRSLEGHTRQFLDIAHFTSYPDSVLCAFYNGSLRPEHRAPLSEDGPRADFAAFVEWTLARNGSPFTVCPVEEFANATPDPEPSPPPTRNEEPIPEPTAAATAEPSATDEPSPEVVTETRCAPEPQAVTTDQVREPEGETLTEDFATDSASAERSSAHCIMAEGELANLREGQKELNIQMTPIPVPRVRPPVPAPRTIFRIPPAHPVIPMPPLPAASPVAHPQPTVRVLVSPRVYQQPSASWQGDPSAPPPTSGSGTPPRLSDPSASPRRLAPSSPSWPVSLPATQGSIVPPAPPLLNLLTFSSVLFMPRGRGFREGGDM